MRRGELLAIKWRHVDLERRTVHLPHTKTGQPRTVPLTDGAVAILTGLKATDEDVFPIDPSALRWAWNTACKEAGITDLHFHDLRHEGVSRLFELELSVPEVALISGHKTMNCLFRYTHLQPIELARKLKGRKPRKY
jgi:integrase